MNKICTLPWMHLETTPLGEFRPCCLAEETIPDYNISRGDTINNAFNSAYMENLRQQFLDGKQPKTCSKCWSLESAGGTSKRMISNKKFGVDTSQKRLKFLDLKLGNICNLKCRICGAWSSSKWAQEEIELGNPTARDWLAQGRWPRQKNKVWNEIISLLPYVEYFEFTGGEPFLIKEHFDILEKSVELGTSKKQQIHYNTNGTTFPTHAVENIWPHFKEVEIAFSVDDIGERFEYQRFPAVWQKVNENIRKFNALKKTHKNIKTQVCCTINMQNIFNLEAVANWIQSQSFDYVFYNYLHEAKEWNVQYLPKNYKQFIQTKLLNNKSPGIHKEELGKALVFMMDKDLGDDQIHWQRSQKIKASDNFRNQSFVKVHPEYQGLL
jgi:organic radical activating enzyme|tara:strand:+ start:664 stop:1809 length:1146 start_codon:yes stop_codon:yes gene_type:complete